MMLKEKSNPWAKLKYLYILPVAAIAVTAFARPEISETAEEISAVKVNDLTAIVEAKAIKSTEESVQISTVSQDTVKVNYVPTEVSRKLQGTAVFEVVEEMPEFPGGVDAMMEYLQKELRYPESAKEKGIQGRVTVHFLLYQSVWQTSSARLPRFRLSPRVSHRSGGASPGSPCTLPPTTAPDPAPPSLLWDNKPDIPRFAAR